MRLFVKLMVLLLIAALAGPFFIKGPDGRPLMTTADVRASISRSSAGLKQRWRRMSTSVARATGNEDAGKTRVFRWQDADGQWHYSDEPPPDGRADVMLVDPEANRMPPPPPAPRVENAPNAPEIPVPVILTPGAVSDAIDDARSARDLLEERDAETRRRIDENQ